MIPTPRQPTKRDVFIVFSKSEPLEAKFALAVKHNLEQLGRFAHEYEDWSWVEQTTTSERRGPDVDQEVLRSMLQACSAVLVIPARHGAPSEGVAIELEMLARLKLPVLLLRWHLTDEEAEPRELNVIYRYQVYGANPDDKWSSAAGPQIAELLWLACNVVELRNRHVPVGNIVLDALPAFDSAPLMAFKLRDGLVNADDYLREPNLDALAQLVTAGATGKQLRSLIEDWWPEADPVLRHLQVDGYAPVRRPCGILYEAMRLVIKQARFSFPDLECWSTDALMRHGIMLTRFREIDDALRLLTDGIERNADFMDRLYAARAMAHDVRGDVDSAVADMDGAVRLAPDKACELVHRFTRAVLRARRDVPEARRAAIEDYTHVLKFSSDESLRLSALNYRAIHFAALGKASAAIADWTAVIKQHADHPRAAAQARLNRAVKYEELGKLMDAREDFTAVLAWADVSSSRRFRALEGRARVLERLGFPAQAADDIEKMLAMGVADPEWRPELQSKVRELRSAAQ